MFYNAKDKCEPIEIFGDTTVFVNGKVVFPGTVGNAMAVIEDLEEETGSYISKSQSIGIYALSEKMEGILFGNSGYYE
ncbi:hypothetical protein [Clostridium estertheticum]|uniref:Uncharacterized protein n=1 Tax=Clostridium estertheticum TaxID=238834 RepID=A0A7Y3SWL7_9CLOT|nr:hypothetical protein [Clostridium estertheticum]NNU76338.1 hypothetical protein [Clostridium estertheticum]WBL45833.1 hypothetical protein LOR37_14195 [Clostridium estertheticum]